MWKRKRSENWGGFSVEQIKNKPLRYEQETKEIHCAKVHNVCNSKKRRELKRASHLGDSPPSVQMKNKPELKVDEISETVVYYEKILQSLKNELDKEERDLFVSNVLQESENKEIELSCHGSSGQCLELLLTECKDPAIMDRFMSAFSQNKMEVCFNSNASHITELLIMHAIQNIKNLTLQSDGEKNVMKNITWIEEFSDFILKNLDIFLGNIYSCHVMCTLIKALGGEINGNNEFRSKKSKLHKEEFRRIHTGQNETHMEKVAIMLEQIPEAFTKILKNMSISLKKLDNIADCASNSSSAAVIQALMQVLKKRLPEICDKFIAKVAKKLYSEKNYDGVPLAFLHKNSSYIVENMFKSASEEMQLFLWHQWFSDCMEKLVNHHVGNYVIQRLFDAVQSKSLFEEMCTTMWNLFNAILNFRRYGIFLAISSACNRLKAQQARFTMNMMQCLNCRGEKRLYFVQLLLGFQKIENFTPSNNFESSEISICSHGSFVTQTMLEFQEPKELVASFLNLKPEQLRYLAGHIKGCQVLNSFFRSISVGEKSKEAMVNILKPIIVQLACDRHTSLTLSRIWVLLSIKLRETLVKELINNEEMLMDDRNGSVVYKKCGGHYFKKNLDQWKNIQANITPSRKN